jgi:hypothetical protein
MPIVYANIPQSIYCSRLTYLPSCLGFFHSLLIGKCCLQNCCCWCDSGVPTAANTPAVACDPSDPVDVAAHNVPFGVGSVLTDVIAAVGVPCTSCCHVPAAAVVLALLLTGVSAFAAVATAVDVPSATGISNVFLRPCYCWRPCCG